MTLSSTLNNASCVAGSPQCAQNFAFPLGSVNGLTIVNTFFILRSPAEDWTLLHRELALSLLQEQPYAT
jgi:hypothetical protein